MPIDLSILLKRSASEHSHLCPRQVLGVRMGLAGLAALGLKAPVTTKTALVIIETDGCFADGIRVATGATVGHRTLRVRRSGENCSHLHQPKDWVKPAAGTQVGYQDTGARVCTAGETPLFCPAAGLPGDAG